MTLGLITRLLLPSLNIWELISGLPIPTSLVTFRGGMIACTRMVPTLAKPWSGTMACTPSEPWSWNAPPQPLLCSVLQPGTKAGIFRTMFLRGCRPWFQTMVLWAWGPCRYRRSFLLWYLGKNQEFGNIQNWEIVADTDFNFIDCGYRYRHRRHL